MGILSWLLDEHAEMTVSITRNPGHLTHEDGCGGGVTLAIVPSRKSTITCSRCCAQAEFDSIYATTSLRLTKEDGNPRSFPFPLYRNRRVRGRLYVIPTP